MIVSMASFSNNRVTTSGDTDMPHTLRRSSSSCCFSGDSGCCSTNFNTVCRMNRLLNIVLPTAPAVPPPRRRLGRVGRGRGAGRGCGGDVAYIVSHNFRGGTSFSLETTGTPPPDGSASSLGISIWTWIWVWANWLTSSFGRTRPPVGDNQVFIPFGLPFLPRSTVQLFDPSSPFLWQTVDACFLFLPPLSPNRAFEHSRFLPLCSCRSPDLLYVFS
ncbi:uncharacterized protein LOC119562737 [Drosophila subpulchrella]|uniref:uncharacterized protein LOC119562737 n=1 Tax=Drosophila subpulchrella TaxID=1486046 RepID=UPI0018A1B4F2|nr:uncharacterized protein LOC119562737 [Drosophila subpulchrella]